MRAVAAPMPAGGAGHEHDAAGEVDHGSPPVVARRGAERERALHLVADDREPLVHAHAGLGEQLVGARRRARGARTPGRRARSRSTSRRGARRRRGARQSSTASTTWWTAPRSGALICMTSAAPARLNARMSSTRVGPLVGDELRRAGRRARRAARRAPRSGRRASRRRAGARRAARTARRRRAIAASDAGHARRGRRRSAGAEHGRRRRSAGSARRRRRGAAARRGRAPSARTRSARRRPSPTSAGVVDQPVRQRVDLLEDHLVHAAAPLLAGLREDRDALAAGRRGPTRPAPARPSCSRRRARAASSSAWERP